MRMFRIPSEKTHDIVHAQLTHRLTLDRGIGQFALLVLELDDALLDGVFDGQLVDDHVDGLVQAVDAVDGLFFDELDQGILV